MCGEVGVKCAVTLGSHERPNPDGSKPGWATRRMHRKPGAGIFTPALAVTIWEIFIGPVRGTFSMTAARWHGSRGALPIMVQVSGAP